MPACSHGIVASASAENHIADAYISNAYQYYRHANINREPKGFSVEAAEEYGE